MRGQYVQITKIRYLCFDLVHSRYTRMAGFGRREIELMQALCIYNIYIEYYSVAVSQEKDGLVKEGCWSRGDERTELILSLTLAGALVLIFIW